MKKAKPNFVYSGGGERWNDTLCRWVGTAQERHVPACKTFSIHDDLCYKCANFKDLQGALGRGIGWCEKYNCSADQHGTCDNFIATTNKPNDGKEERE